MPIWIELTVLMLAAYAAGLVGGWLVWANHEDTEAPDGERVRASEEDDAR